MAGQTFGNQRTHARASGREQAHGPALAHVLDQIGEVVGALAALRDERMRQEAQAVRVKLAVAHARKRLSRR